MPAPDVSLYILVADGARPDTLARHMDAGMLPALARLRAEGGAYTVSTAWPSVTGVAYTPFLLGRYPGSVGLPGLRWFDRSRRIGAWSGHARSYVGPEMRHMDRELAPDAPTMFELAERSLGALNVISRGLSRSRRLAYSPRFILRTAVTHFVGRLRGWLAIDREVARALAARIRRESPEFVFACFPGIDKASHADGHESTAVVEAMQILDETVAELRHDAERRGTWERTHVWIASDHGHSPVTDHDDLAERFRDAGYRTLAHPWAFGNSHEVAVMVSGNAMAHVYLDLHRRERPFWNSLQSRWHEDLRALLARPSVDLAIVAHGAALAQVHSRDRGWAWIAWSDGRYSYRPEGGNPLGVCALECVTASEAYDAAVNSDYPDAIVQIAHLVSSPRSGDIVLSAARGWDFRRRYEPIAHVSTHGALHREHMAVPLLLSRPARTAPRRTVDVMPSALRALGRPVPAGLDGLSFV